jgi:ribosomal protein S18 acetylase RimI-like enzyme
VSPEIRLLQPPDFDAAARLFADAFIDDPGWVAVGPDADARRHRLLRRYHRAALGVIHRYGGPTYGAFPHGTSELAGVAATFAPGRYPPPLHTFVRYVPGFLPAGPGPIVRGLRFAHLQEHGHPDEEHAYLWLLAVHPTRQRGGVGRALLARVYESAQGAPVHLDTANPANLPYYASNGFR